VSGGQKGVIAFAAVFYPTPIRSTGVGWALGIGRIGGIAGPFLFGMLLGWNLAPASALCIAALPMLLAAGIVIFMGWLSPPAAINVRASIARPAEV
jgi:MFS transporter, AAHS family, 4-hydroxybenzoate transporter